MIVDICQWYRSPHDMGTASASSIPEPAGGPGDRAMGGGRERPRFRRFDRRNQNGSRAHRVQLGLPGIDCLMLPVIIAYIAYKSLISR